MSLRYALVGLLASRPSSGYELSKRFAVSMAHVWPVGHSQIYPELSRLLADGLIEQTEQGPRGAKDLTPPRRQGWKPCGIGWRPNPTTACRSDANLREFFLWALPPAEALAHLQRDADVYRQRLGELEKSPGRSTGMPTRQLAPRGLPSRSAWQLPHVIDWRTGPRKKSPPARSSQADAYRKT